MTATVTFAFSELRSLISKAARGAGLSWGLAEEAGWAAEWLARRGMPAADWATHWLAACGDGAVSPVEIGIALVEDCATPLAVNGKVVADGLTAPGYLLPFLHRIAEAGSAVAVVSAAGRVAQISSAGEITFGPAWQRQSSGWWLSDGETAGLQTGAAARPAVSAEVLDCLEGLALRTTVPRSDASRRNAGSTSDDND